MFSFIPFGPKGRILLTFPLSLMEAQVGLLSSAHQEAPLTAPFAWLIPLVSTILTPYWLGYIAVLSQSTRDMISFLASGERGEGGLSTTQVSNEEPLEPGLLPCKTWFICLVLRCGTDWLPPTSYDH